MQRFAVSQYSKCSLENELLSPIPRLITKT